MVYLHGNLYRSLGVEFIWDDVDRCYNVNGKVAGRAKANSLDSVEKLLRCLRAGSTCYFCFDTTDDGIDIEVVLYYDGVKSSGMSVLVNYGKV